MTDSKHTPAPWSLNKKERRSYRNIYDANGFSIAFCAPYGNQEDLLVAAANATP